MVNKRCELCKGKARMYCESDQASLCWDCDAAVHSANFLVARHSRNLLCRVCQSPTPWSASGAKLGSTFSVCEKCVDRGKLDGDESGVEDGEHEPEVVEENHVAPPPLVAADSSFDDEKSTIGGDVVVSRKRVRRLESDDDNGCCIRTPSSDFEAASVVDSVLSRSKTTPLQKVQRNETGRVKVFGYDLNEAWRGNGPSI